MVTELKTYDNDTKDRKFVAVGGFVGRNSATILTSLDGISWTSTTYGNRILFGVKYVNYTFVAVGAS